MRPTKSYVDKLESLERRSRIVLLRAASNATNVASLAVPVNQNKLLSLTESKSVKGFMSDYKRKINIFGE